MVKFLVNAFDIFVEITIILIFIRVILSWFNVNNNISNLINEVTDPILSPIKKIIPSKTVLDFSPLVAILLLQALQYLVHFLVKSLL